MLTLKRTKKKHHSKQQWLDEHASDPFVKKAKQQGFRSRAVYKLQEINERDRILRRGMTVVDLGAAPGGWSQVASQVVGDRGRVIALDILPMDPIPGVGIISGDFKDDEVFETLIKTLNGNVVDLVISDMAPNISGMDAIDQPRILYLAELALDFSSRVLGTGGDLLVKVFQGAGFEAYMADLKQRFEKVIVRKPKASRPRSREVYLLARGYQSH